MYEQAHILLFFKLQTLTVQCTGSFALTNIQELKYQHILRAKS